MRLGAWDYLPWESRERWQEALDTFRVPAERPTAESAARLDPQALLHLIEAQSGGVVYALHPLSTTRVALGPLLR